MQPNLRTSSYLFYANRKGSTQGDVRVPSGREIVTAGGGPDFPEAACKPVRVSNHSKHHSTITRLSPILPSRLIPSFREKERKKKAPFQRFEFCRMNQCKTMLSPPSRTFPLNSDKWHRTAGSEVCDPYKIEKAFFYPLKSYGYLLIYKSILNESLQYGKVFSHEIKNKLVWQKFPLNAYILFYD